MKSTKINPTAKLLVFDLETSNLEANRGFIIAAAAKWIGEKEAKTWIIGDTPGYGKSPRSFLDDSLIVSSLVPLLSQADAVIAYYGSGFDVPYVNTRCLANRLALPPKFTVIDPWKTARSKLKLARNDMGSVAALVNTKFHKEHLPWKDWEIAPHGDIEAQKRLLKYCVNDVRVLEEAYLALRPLMYDHPYVGDASPVGGTQQCPACGSVRTIGHGIRRTRKFIVNRRRCNGCGSSFESSKQAIK